MTADLLMQPAEAAPGRAPHSGLIDRLIGLPARMPGLGVAWYAVLVPVLVVGLSAPSWVAGVVPWGTVLAEVVGPSVLAAYLLGSIHGLNRIARTAFEQFRPALGEHPDADRLRVHLTTIPDRAGVIVILLAELVVTGGFFSDDAALRRFAEHPPAVAVGQVVAWWLAIAAAALVILHTVRQLRAVGGLHAAATSIDLFEPGPIIAFSRLTSATAFVLLIVPVLIAASATLEGVTDASAFDIVQQVTIILLAVATFLIPLLGMHDRMTGEKSRLAREVHDRLKATTARIHAGVDAHDLADAAQLNSTLSSLLAERDLVDRLPTWPWSPGLVRGFASAVLLPVLFLLLTQVLERML